MGRPTKEQQIDIAKRRSRAVELRDQGRTWQQIAVELGYGSGGAAARDITRAREAALAEMRDTIEEWRTRELARLETLYDAAVEVLGRFHVHVSGGTIVREGEPVLDDEGRPVIAEGVGAPLLDDSPVLAAIDRLVRISESIRKLKGLDAPTKVETTGTVRYEIVGVDPQDLT